MLCRGTDAWRMHSQYSTNILLLNQQNWADFCFQGLDSCATKDTRTSWFWQMVCRVPGGMLLLFIYTHLIWSDDHFKNPSTEFQKHFFSYLLIYVFRTRHGWRQIFLMETHRKTEYLLMFWTPQKQKLFIKTCSTSSMRSRTDLGK